MPSNPVANKPPRIAITLGLITLLGPASIDMYLPSMPVMASELRAPFATVQLSLTVFLLAMGAGQLLFGPVIDALGRRRPLLLAIAVFAALRGVEGSTGTAH